MNTYTFKIKFIRLKLKTIKISNLQLKKYVHLKILFIARKGIFMSYVISINIYNMTVN